MEIPTQQNHVYTLTCDNACEVYDVDTDRLIHVHHAGEVQSQFTAIGMKVSLTDDTAHITELFNGAPAGNGGGGYIESDLNIGHGARAAVCTLTAGNMAQGGSLTDGEDTVTLAEPAKGYGWAGIADATAAGTITFGTHEAIAFDARPGTYATGYMAIVDPSKGGTLTIGEWSKTFAAAQGAKASGTFDYMLGAVIVDGTPVTPPADASSVEGWNNAFLTAGVGLVCTDVDAHGEVSVSVEAAEPGTAGNSITISVENYPDVTLSGGTDGRTVAALLAELEADTDFPCELEHDGEGNVTLTAKVEGTAGNYSMSCTDAGFITPDAMLVGGEDGRTPQEVVDAIAEAAAGYLTGVELDAMELGFTFAEATRGDIASVAVDGGLFGDTLWTAGDPDWTLADVVDAVNAGGTYPLGVKAEAGENGTYTLTERTAGLAGNQRVFTATGPFGSGDTRQGSTTRGMDVTSWGINLNGEPLDVEPAPVPEPLGTTTTLKHGHVYTLAVAANTDLSALTVAQYATCELWIDYTAGSVTWPTLYWLDGTSSDAQHDHDVPPAMSAVGRYRVTLRNEGSGVTYANVAYSSAIPTTPAQS